MLWWEQNKRGVRPSGPTRNHAVAERGFGSTCVIWSTLPQLTRISWTFDGSMRSMHLIAVVSQTVITARSFDSAEQR